MQESAAAIMASKIVREVFRISQAYGESLSFSFDDYLHDFTLMLSHADLDKVSLIFCDDHQRTLLEYAYHIRDLQVVENCPVDSVGGVAVVPLSQPFTLIPVITRKGKDKGYTSQLRIRWGEAPTYSRNGGDSCTNPHFEKKTGGRAEADIYADRQLRKRGRVKFYLPDKRYGFIVPDEPGSPDVFFHQDETPGPLQAGDRVSYLPLATPRGVQARAIECEE